MNSLCKFLFILIVALQAADAYLTCRILGAGGRELNPVMRFLMDRIGVMAGLIVAKVSLSIAIGLYLGDQPPLLILIAVVYGCVVVSNWNQMRRASVN
jgi:hypothetical protein